MLYYLWTRLLGLIWFIPNMTFRFEFSFSVLSFFFGFDFFRYGIFSSFRKREWIKLNRTENCFLFGFRLGSLFGGFFSETVFRNGVSNMIRISFRFIWIWEQKAGFGNDANSTSTTFSFNFFFNYYSHPVSVFFLFCEP